LSFNSFDGGTPLQSHAIPTVSTGSERDPGPDLYATTWGAWRRVVLPQLATGIIAGALLAFALSLDDFIISFFVSGPTTQTLPLLIYGSLRRGLSPEIHALSTAMVVLTLLALLGALHWRQLSEQTSAGARWMRRGLGATGAVMLLALALLGAKGLRKPAGQEGHPPVNVLMYSEYIDPAMIGEFTALTGYPLNIEVYEAQEEMIAKLQAAGAGEYDVIVASDVAILQMRQLGLIQRLNREALPNARNLDPLFLHAPFDPDNAYTEPYLWGTTGILYRDAELEPAQVSWSLLFEPGKARGNFLLLDESRTMLSVGLDAIGRDSNSTSREDIRAAAEAILRAKHEPHCVGFDGSVGGKDKVLAGTAWAAIVFNGEAMAAMGEDETLQYAIPSEGSSIWLDTMTVSSGSRNVPGAHAFINYILSADAGAKLANFVQFGSPNAAARPQLTPEDLSNPVIYPDAATLKRLKYLRDPGPAQRTYDEAWTAVKSR